MRLSFDVVEGCGRGKLTGVKYSTPSKWWGHPFRRVRTHSKQFHSVLVPCHCACSICVPSKYVRESTATQCTHSRCVSRYAFLCPCIHVHQDVCCAVLLSLSSAEVMHYIGTCSGSQDVISRTLTWVTMRHHKLQNQCDEPNVTNTPTGTAPA